MQTGWQRKCCVRACTGLTGKDDMTLRNEQKTWPRGKRLQQPVITQRHTHQLQPVSWLMYTGKKPLDAHTPLHAACTHSVHSSWGFGSSKDVLFWERCWVSHPSLVTDRETGCKYQTLHKEYDTPKYTRTQIQTDTCTLTFLYLLISRISRNIVSERLW